MNTKTCSKCGEARPISEYHKNANSKDGLRPDCKPCALAVKKKYYDANRERLISCVQANYDKERKREYDRQRLLDPQVRERTRQAKRAYDERNHEGKVVRTRNRRARIRKAEGRHTLAEIRRLYTSQSGRCALCQIELNGKYHADHIYPVSKGGSNWISNIQLLCAPCNLKKSNKIDP